MCGIFGFWLNRPLRSDDVERGRRGTAMLAYRGPDGGGEWVDVERGVFFGHRRLAILDLTERSAQPMRRGPATVTYNGELFNYAELRDELRAVGETFSTDGDTEVLLAAWNRWGEAALDRFDAMFAFAIFDAQGLWLATDPFGEKPLYVAQTEEGCWFASEPRPLIDTLGLSFNPSAEDRRLFLGLGFLPAPRTGYPGLEVLPPATLRHCGLNRAVTERRYWRPPQGVAGKGQVAPIGESAIEDVAAALIRSLRVRLRSDVPIGLFLSSGVDSALVAALCARELNIQLSTYTVSFPDGVDEAPAAAEIAGHLGLSHTIIDGRDQSMPEKTAADLVDLYAVPNDNISGLSVARMSALARPHVKVALSGSGGDELAFGYNKYQFLWRRRRLFALPGPLVNAFAVFDPLLKALPSWRLARDYLAGDRAFRFLAVKNSGFAHLLRDLGGGLPALDPPPGDLAMAARALDLDITLPGSYLPAIDRGSMRSALEVRTPYLSRAVFDAVRAIDPRALIGGEQKALLRRILRRYLPAHLVDRPKRGFVSPLDRYVRRLGAVPRVAGVPEAAAERLWRERGNPAAASIILRLGVLAELAR